MYGMRINTIIQSFYPVTGGAETHVYEINKELVRRGHDVTVHTLAVTIDGKRLPLYDEIEGIKIRRYKPIISFGQQHIFMNFWVPKINDCDIIDLQGYPSLVNDYICFKYKKNAIVFTPHGGLFNAPPKFTVSSMFKIYNKFLGFRTLKRIDTVIAQTEGEKKRYKAMGIEKVIVGPSGLHDMVFEKYNAENIKSKYGLTKYMFFLGRMFYEKGPCNLVKVFVLIKDKFKDVSLVFAGPDAGEVAKVKKLAKEFGIEDRVIYAGRVSEKEKYELFAGCEFFVLPSMFEAQGIVFIEAFAQGKPVIGTRVGGVPWVVEDNVTGLLVDYGDIKGLAEKMEYLLKNPEICKKMGAKGKEVAWQKYRWKNIIDRIEALYQELVDKRVTG
ncbi:MAG: glycosyltransferase family 4 protein [Nanoarchaeota archaeon]|nr:glycosyltransferase family 4 protein [Nanoarchaeota archaeon]